MTEITSEQGSKQVARQLVQEIGPEHSARAVVDSPAWLAGNATVELVAVCSDHRPHRFRITVEMLP